MSERNRGLALIAKESAVHLQRRRQERRKDSAVLRRLCAGAQRSPSRSRRETQQIQSEMQYNFPCVWRMTRILPDSCSARHIIGRLARFVEVLTSGVWGNMEGGARALASALVCKEKGLQNRVGFCTFCWSAVASRMRPSTKSTTPAMSSEVPNAGWFGAVEMAGELRMTVGRETTQTQRI